jgi:hypothetical protein
MRAGGTPCRASGVPRLGLAHVRAVRLDPAAERDVIRGQRLDEERQLIWRGRHVGVGEDREIALRGEHPGPDRGALAAVGHDEDRQTAAAHLAPGPHEVAVPSVLPSSTTSTSISGGSPAEPCAPSRAWVPPRSR